VHEMSIATEVCRMVEERLGGDAFTLVEVGLDVGIDSGLEAENLKFCLETLLAQPPFRGARALIERPPGDVLRLAFMEIDDGNPEN
jgi:Zn finger protein HypA/HybF involved in hydrogenase expression